MTKSTEAIQHITAGELADDPDKAVKEFDMAAALIDELSSSLAQQKEAEVADAGEDESEPEEEPAQGEGGGQPEEDESEDESEGEPAEGGVLGSVTEKAGMVGEKVGAVKESVPTPVALAGLGVVAALAAFGAMKALSGRGGGAEGE